MWSCSDPAINRKPGKIAPPRNATGSVHQSTVTADPTVNRERPPCRGPARVERRRRSAAGRCRRGSVRSRRPERQLAVASITERHRRGSTQTRERGAGPGRHRRSPTSRPARRPFDADATGESVVPCRRIVGRVGRASTPDGPAQAPFDARVADVDDESGVMAVGPAGTCRPAAIRRRPDGQPLPRHGRDRQHVAAEQACASSLRTTSLPVSSALLTATISGFSARSGLYSSSSRRIAR